MSAALSCSNTSSDSSPQISRTELEQSLAKLRESQGEPWGVTVPGLAAAVVSGADDPAELLDAVSGSSDPPGNTALATSDRFHVGSVTKTFTAALIMQLAQEGKLSISDPISKWIEFPGGDDISIRMLLGHTSGIQSFDELPGHSRLLSPEQSIDLAAAVPPLFNPGSSWAYSNSNYTMLGVIAEKASGSTWESEVSERFFGPLGLRDTYVWSGKSKGSTVAGSRLTCGQPNEPKCAPPRPGFRIVPEEDGFDWTVSWAAGAIVSTPADLVRWMDALMGGEVVDKAHLDLMMTPTPESIEELQSLPKYGPLKWTGDGLGLLQYQIDEVGTAYGHEGLINGFSANVAHVPAKGLTVAVASNFVPFDTFEALGDLIVRSSAADAGPD